MSAAVRTAHDEEKTGRGAAPAKTHRFGDPDGPDLALLHLGDLGLGGNLVALEYPDRGLELGLHQRAQRRGQPGARGRHPLELGLDLRQERRDLGELGLDFGVPSRGARRRCRRADLGDRPAAPDPGARALLLGRLGRGRREVRAALLDDRLPRRLALDREVGHGGLQEVQIRDVDGRKRMEERLRMATMAVGQGRGGQHRG